jgi:hypothetical protein
MSEREQSEVKTLRVVAKSWGVGPGIWLGNQSGLRESTVEHFFQFYPHALSADLLGESIPNLQGTTAN